MSASTDTHNPTGKQAKGADPKDDSHASYAPGQIQTRIGLSLVVLAIAAGLVTLAILTGITPIAPSSKVVFALEIIIAVLMVMMVGIIFWQIIQLMRARRKGMAGARLHVRLVTLFSLVAAIPAVIVIVFASVTLDKGLDTMFAKSTKAIVDNAFNVAESYVRGYEPVMRNGMKAMVSALANPEVKKVFEKDKQKFPKLLNTLRALSSFHVVYIVKENGALISAAFDRKRDKPPRPPAWAIEEAKAGKMNILTPPQADLLVGIIKIKNYEDVYLYAYRFVDPQAVANLNKARIGKAQYLTLERRRGELQTTFMLISITVALMFLLAAIWLGLTVADRLVAPIVRLMEAAKKISRGIFDVKVPVHRSEGDLAALGTTFNKMTSQLQFQHAELTDANHLLTERRRFIEAVLSGVTSGVIGLDQKGKITLVNHSALRLLGFKENGLLDKQLEDVLAVFYPTFSKAKAKVAGTAEDQLRFEKDGVEHNFVIRVMVERHGHETDFGYVLTFDDTTELVAAQRNSAWADIARRIAHEIKNPLTPIQLSAERLRRRYGDKITGDREVFEQCTETIIRQVGDIGRMVDEFSSFARMPKAVMENADLVEVIKQGVVLQRMGQSDVTFDLDLPDDKVIFEFDRRLITQAITNLIKNASEAIDAKRAELKTHSGHIRVVLTIKPDRILLDVIDNGIGLPKKNRTRLVEPYMTTREKGTGLGLAIVMKIMEEHDGKIALRDAPNLKRGESGAMLRLEFPIKRKFLEKPQKTKPAASRKRNTKKTATRRKVMG